jgi:hypothetical protein
MTDKVDMLIKDDRRITSEVYATIGIGKMAVMAIIRELGYRKVCARWVSKMLTVEHKAAQKNISNTVRKTEMLFCQE